MRVSSRFKRWLFTGLILLVPIVVTIYLFAAVVNMMDGLIRLVPAPYQPDHLLGFHIPGLGVALTFIIVLLTGMVGASVIGKWFVHLGETIVNRIPLVRTVYGALKHVLETVLQDNKDTFRRVVLIEYPRPGLFVLAFVSGVDKGEIQHRAERHLLTVFVPTTPNPTSGFLVYVPEEDVIPLDMSVEDGMKYVISAGVICPEWAPIRNLKENT